MAEEGLMSIAEVLQRLDIDQNALKHLIKGEKLHLIQKEGQLYCREAEVEVLAAQMGNDEADDDIALDDEPEPIEVTLDDTDAEDEPDPISLVDEDEVGSSEDDAPKVSYVQTSLTGGQGAIDTSKLTRDLLKGANATRCRTFHAKLSDAALAYMNSQVNEWVDSEPEIEIKFATSTIGVVEGKHAEPHLIVTIFY